MSEFNKKVKNPFSVRFTRKKDGDTVKYTTLFWMPSGVVQSVTTRVDEKKAAADGVDTAQIADSVKADHYNKISDLLHKALVTGLNIKE